MPTNKLKLLLKHPLTSVVDQEPYQRNLEFPQFFLPEDGQSAKKDDKIGMVVPREPADPFGDAPPSRAPTRGVRTLYKADRSRSSEEKIGNQHSGFTAAQLKAIDKGMARGETQLEALERHQAREEKQSSRCRFNGNPEEHGFQGSYATSSSSSEYGVPDYPSDDNDDTTDNNQHGGFGLGILSRGSQDRLLIGQVVSHNDRANSATLDRFLSSEIEPLAEDTSALR